MDPFDTAGQSVEVTKHAVDRVIAERIRRFNEVLRAEFIPALRSVLLENKRQRRDILKAATETASILYFEQERPAAMEVPLGHVPFGTTLNYPCGICGKKRGVRANGECNDCGLQAPCWIDDGIEETRAPAFDLELSGELPIPSPAKVLAAVFNPIISAWRRQRIAALRLTEVIAKHFASVLRDTTSCTGEERQLLIQSLVRSASLLVYKRPEPTPADLPADVVIEPSRAYSCSMCENKFRMNVLGQCDHCCLQCPIWILPMPNEVPETDKKSP